MSHKRYNSEKFIWENTSIESLENQVLHKPYLSNFGRNIKTDKLAVKQKKKKADLN